MGQLISTSPVKGESEERLLCMIQELNEKMVLFERKMNTCERRMNEYEQRTEECEQRIHECEQIMKGYISSKDLNNATPNAESVTRKARRSTDEKKRSSAGKSQQRTEEREKQSDEQRARRRWQKLFPYEDYEHFDDVAAYRPLLPVSSPKNHVFGLFRIIAEGDCEWYIMRRAKDHWTAGIKDLREKNKDAEVELVHGWVNVSNSIDIGVRLRATLDSKLWYCSGNTICKRGKNLMDIRQAERNIVDHIRDIISDTEHSCAD